MLVKTKHNGTHPVYRLVGNARYLRCSTGHKLHAAAVPYRSRNNIEHTRTSRQNPTHSVGLPVQRSSEGTPPHRVSYFDPTLCSRSLTSCSGHRRAIHEGCDCASGGAEERRSGDRATCANTHATHSQTPTHHTHTHRRPAGAHSPTELIQQLRTAPLPGQR